MTIDQEKLDKALVALEATKRDAPLHEKVLAILYSQEEYLVGPGPGPDPAMVEAMVDEKVANAVANLSPVASAALMLPLPKSDNPDEQAKIDAWVQQGKDYATQSLAQVAE